MDNKTAVSRPYDAEYEIQACGGLPIKIGHVVVQAATKKEAAQKVVAWVHDHDVMADPRIDPIVVIRGIDRVVA